jgi:hypothetical protein
MTPGPQRLLITLGLALAVAGAVSGIFYFQQRSAESASKQSRADSNLVSDEQRIAEAERRIFASLPEKQAAYEQAFAVLSAAGIVHSASLGSRDAIHKREEMVRRFDDANTALEEVFKKAEATLRSDLLSEGFSEYTSSKAAARFSQKSNIESILKIRACDRESNATFLDLLDLLDARWGTWKPGAEDHLKFDHTSDANAYNTLRQRIVEIGARELAIQTAIQQKTQPSLTPKLLP